MKKLWLVAGLCVWSTDLAAHEVWLEQDASGPVRIFLGEPDYPVPAGGDPEFNRLRAPRVFRADAGRHVPTVRRADHLEADLPGDGDVRLRDDSIFPPERDSAGNTSARIYYARAGRTEARALLDFEIVPLQPGANSFQILFKGKPASREGVRILRPDGWLKNIKSDNDGRFALIADQPGRYLLFADHVENLNSLPGKPGLVKVTHITTLSFVNP